MIRALAVAALLLLLAACGRGDLMGPFAETQAPPALSPRFYPPEGWAWGFIETGGKPAQRYGVAAGWRAPKATVVILPGYGESAEAWFETASGLIRRGYTVWILERAGQGGSGRYTLPRDLGFVPSFDPDVANVRALVRVVIRPPETSPLILLGHSDGAVVAIRAVETGLKVDGVIISSPDVTSKAVSTDSVQALAGRAGLGRLPSADWRPWSRSSPDARGSGLTHDPWRGRVQQAWQVANPDLRMSSASLGWRGAHQAASRAAEADAAAVKTDVLMLLPDKTTKEALALCKVLPDCRSVAVPGSLPALHLEQDRFRQPWMDQVTGYIAAKVTAAREAEVAPPMSQTPIAAPVPEENAPPTP
ncbi:MAG: alpha/beta hydrolase [Phenylobacterium sp.]|uniref:alpha/beta hydrolase n=1 Tax=Phenylobacterium sp. TaxID=1871053 RepID=UPI001B5314D0|nr:alpha/beta hydrolase [Phenylobacterium sp.]MBP7815243.1 alpha/beta hydrolase [Phenylobacterium sp.]